ncbi:DMT family transporter [Aureimonas ureilytica]|nr:DMT family transporter [Aureimonas ureilytica]
MSLASTTLARPMSNSMLGWAAMCAALVTWAGFSLSMRGIGASALTPSDVALLRFAVPALILLPLVPARLRELKSVRLAPALMIVMGAGLPFFGLVAAGGRFTSAAHVSALVAGTAPLAVAILARVLTGQRGASLPGLATIVLGIALLVLGLGVVDGRVIAGAALLLAASFLWGTYTMGMRLAAVTPMTCLMLVTYPSAIAIALLKASGVFESHLGSIDPHQVLVFAGVQGIGTGIVSTLVYAIAVRHLGALRCATMGALAPVLVTGAAIPLLGEQPTLLTIVGVVAVALGVAMANTRRAGPSRPARAG